MRRVWPAIGVCALALACGRPNPGFKLIETGDVGGSEGQSGSLGSTDSGVVTSSPPPTSTVGTGTDGSDSASASGTASETGASTSMAGMHQIIPPSCDETLQIDTFVPAAEDTFFINEGGGVGICSFTQSAPDCRDLAAGESGSLTLYLQDDPNLIVIDEPHGIYAVRFTEPTYEGLVITPDVVLGLEASIRLFGPNEDEPLVAMLKAYRFAAQDTWSAGKGLEYTTCHSPAASHRCRVCPPDGLPPDSACEVDWSQGMLDVAMMFISYPYDQLLLPATKVEEVPGADGIDFRIPLTADDLPDMLATGLMLMPATDLMPGILEIKSLDWGDPDHFPGLWVHHCKPIWVPDN